MASLAIPALVAFVLALALGGSMRHWIEVRLRWPLLILLPFPVLLVLYNPPLETQPWAVVWGPHIWQLAQLALVAGLARNAFARRGYARIPWLLALTGVFLNTLVVTANGGYMPVSPDAPAWIIDKTTSATGVVRLHNTIVMNASTQLNWLGDILLQPGWVPPRPNVLSVGDLLLSVGSAWWVFV